MTFAFGHLAGAWAAGKLYEYFSQQQISYYSWFFLLFGGILPDADLVVDWIFGLRKHRHVTHSLLFLLGAPAAVYLGFTLLGSPESASYAFFLGLGIFMHLFLDAFSKYGVALLWPKLWYFSFFSGISKTRPETTFLSRSREELQYILKLAVIDMAIGTIWIFYLWFSKGIQF